MSDREGFEKYAQFTELDVIGYKDDFDCYGNSHTQDVYEGWQEGRISGWQAALEAACNEILTSMSAEGAWLDSPKAVCAAIRALMEGKRG